MGQPGMRARAWAATAGCEPLSSRGLARAVGTYEWHAWSWLSGRTSPSLDGLVRIARALDVPVERVLYACLEARERYRAEQEAERVRREAE